MEVLQGVSKELRTDPVFGEWIEEEPVMLGVDKFTEELRDKYDVEIVR